MDIFRYRTDPATPTKLEHGEIVNGLRSKMWVERYLEHGEFEFIGPASSRIREKLPIGSFVSHVDTDEVMVVETHSISESKGEKSDIVVSGRSFETILEQRIVSSNRYFPNNLGSADYVMAANYSWLQAVYLLEQHVLAANLIDDYDAIPWLDILSAVGITADSVERSVKRGQDLYSAVLELLEIDNLGIKIVRPSIFTDFIQLHIYRGVDRQNEIMFSHDSGEIESADYLWSNKLHKTSALVSGRWVEVRVDSLAHVEYGRRMMYVDASDIDESFDAAPTGTDLTDIVVKMEQRGTAALAAQRDIALTKTEVTQTGTRAKYREDYDLGDLVTVHGDYHETSTRRVIEYVEIEDEQGMRSYPTLTADE